MDNPLLVELVKKGALTQEIAQVAVNHTLRQQLLDFDFGNPKLYHVLLQIESETFPFLSETFKLLLDFKLNLEEIRKEKKFQEEHLQQLLHSTLQKLREIFKQNPRYDSLEWLEKGLKGESLFVQSRLLSWFLRTAAYSEINPMNSSLFEKESFENQILKTLFELKDSSLRQKATIEILDRMKFDQKKSQKLNQTLAEKIARAKLKGPLRKNQSLALKPLSKHAILPCTLLAYFVEDEASKEVCDKLLQAINDDRTLFREYKPQHILFQLLMALHHPLDLTQSEKRELLSSLLLDTSLSAQEKVKGIEAARDLIALGASKYLKNNYDIRTLPTLLRTAFKTTLHEEENLQFDAKFDATFGHFRKPETLYTYAGSLQSLPPEEKEIPLSLLHEYVENVMEGTFKEKRYQTESRDHLEKVFKNNARLEDEWRRGSKKQQGSFTLVDTDDPNHLLVMGSEVEGSCLRPDGNPEYNKCLLAALLDGKNRLIAILNSKGEIVARSFFRLLLDKETGRPVLFLERMYAKEQNPAYKNLLKTMALERAEALSLPLFANPEDNFSDSKIPLYPNPLISLKGRVPFEYVDTNQKVESLPYEVSQAILLTTSPREEGKQGVVLETSKRSFPPHESE